VAAAWASEDGCEVKTYPVLRFSLKTESASGASPILTTRNNKECTVRSIKIAALSLASMLVVGSAMVGNAAAVPLWLVCLEGSGLTKYSGSQCTTASASGKWQLLGLPSGKVDTVKLVPLTLTLKDTKTLLGESEVVCFSRGSEAEAVVEGKNKGKITSVGIREPEKNCKGVKVCKPEEVEEIEGVGLPWNTELFETEKQILTKLSSSGNGEPGWKVKCNTIGGTEIDECVSVSTEKTPQAKFESKVSGTELLALGTFETGHLAKCSQKEEESGEILGQFALLTKSGNGLGVDLL
jgi:hypothetical protein